MTASEFKQLYEKKDNTISLPVDIKMQVEECLSLQVHTKGIKPSYNLNGINYKPKNYNPDFDKIIKSRILNRHPNENEVHYNWRLSVYEPIQNEIFVKFLNIAKGILCNDNNFSISVDEKTENYIKKYTVYEIVNNVLEFILQNKYGYIAVIEWDIREKDNTEDLTPIMALISPKDLLMYSSEAVAFRHDGYVIYIDKNIQVTYRQDKNKLISIHEFQRKINVLPIKEIHNSYLSPFMYWSNLLIRNLNEDETVSKHYSTPIKQMVLPACNAEGCINGKVTDDSDINNIKVLNCSVCNGTGLMSTNPGEHYNISEDTLYKLNGQMYDTAKFITPDIGIPEYHLKRWQLFYDRTQESLFLKNKINATESAEAKREDKKDFYAFMMSISNDLFEITKWVLKEISKYLNYNGVTFEYGEVAVYKPKQFDIMSDEDIIYSFAEIQNKTDDIQLLAEMQYQVNKRIYKCDEVQLKINEILYIIDYLYGVSGNALKSKYLSQTFTPLDKILHDKGYKILLQLSNSIGEEEFINTKNNVIKDYLLEEVKKIAPQNIYEQ